MSAGQLTPLRLLPETRAERIRLLLVATLLPALCVATNTAAFSFAEFDRSLPSLLFFFALLIGQIAVLGWAAGRLIEHPVWRWLVFGWGILLVDLLVYSIPNMFWTSAPPFQHAMISGQTGMLIVWGVLGRRAWAWRLPAVVVAITFTSLMSAEGGTWHGTGGALLVWCQSIGTAAIALVMRGCGFGLEVSNWSNCDAPEKKPLQFSLLNLLVWMTAIAPVLAILRVADRVELRYLSYDNNLMRGATSGVIMSMLSVVAMWSALGRGSIWSRIAILLAFVPTIGLITSVLSYWMSWSSSRGPGLSVSNFYEFAGVGDWIAWVCLAAFFLAATLQIFRASGYRLQRAAERQTQVD